ncbi:hypothetical protein HYV21_01525 [Candidatus Microgenomates bacterium]|nr:hypothetical protein [Candidatus Microgenomates bacterium]
MKRLVYLLTFLTVTPLTIVASFVSLISLSQQTPLPTSVSQKTLIEAPQFGVEVFAALPSHTPSLSTAPIPGDARVEMVRQYLGRYRSPLEPFAPFLVAVSDQYGMDYRLLVAIAQQESNLCKKMPPQTYNCWGWGIHSEGTLGFRDYPTAIQTVAQGLREEYIDKGYDTVEKIMAKYTPLSEGSWAAGVNQFLTEME